MAARVLLAMALARSAAASGEDAPAPASSKILPPPPPASGADTARAWFYRDAQCHHIAKDTDVETYTIKQCHDVADGGSEMGMQCGNGKYNYKYYSNPGDCRSDQSGEERTLDLGECLGPDSKGHYVTIACGADTDTAPAPAPGPAPPPSKVKAVVTFYRDDQCEHHAPDTEHEVYKLNGCQKVDNNASEMGVSCDSGMYEYKYYSQSSNCSAPDGDGTLRSISLGECTGPDSRGNYVKVACGPGEADGGAEAPTLYEEGGGAAVPGPGLPAGGALALLAVVGAVAVRAARWRRAPPAADEELLVA